MVNAVEQGDGLKSRFARVEYAKLDPRQQEIYNFQWLSGVLAKYGYHTHRIPDDWHGADFIARHMITHEQIMVQQKGRLHFAKRYMNKELWIAFRYEDQCYLYPHDELLARYLMINSMENSRSWEEGEVHWPVPTKALLQLLAPYEVNW